MTIFLGKMNVGKRFLAALDFTPTECWIGLMYGFDGVKGKYEFGVPFFVLTIYYYKNGAPRWLK